MDIIKYFVLFLLAVISFAEDNIQCPQKADIISKLLNFDTKYTFPCMYSGFVQVDKDTNSNLFYWFFRDEKQASNAPLVMWLNGGPGSSSQLGNLIENGPLKFVKDEKGKTKVHSLTGQAWNAVANVVYLDQPIGVGFSYGNLAVTNMTQIGNHTIEFLKGFYLKHPEMAGRDFFITGESYGGKYEPGMASAIIDYNKIVSDKDKIPLKGVLIGNGFVDPVVQRLTIRDLSLALGSIQFDSLPELDTIEKRCHAANGKKDPNAPIICGGPSGFVSTMDGGMDMYDSRWLASNDTIVEAMLEEYFNTPEVLVQLHCEKSTKTRKYAISNETVYTNFLPDGMIRYIDEHQKILDNGITLLIFVGQFDRKDGPYGVQEWMKKLKWEGMQDFHASSRNLYYYVSDENNEIRLGGNYKQHKNLNLLMVYAAGHLVPSTQLALSRNMLSDIIYSNTLLCHEKDGKCSLDQTTCNFMNNCTGHGNCVTGKCKWEPGYFGADCSITTETLDSHSFSMNATGWRYFELENNVNKMKVTIHCSKGPVTVYTRREDVPSQTFYDWYLEASAGSTLEFYATKEGSGKYIALFNPDLDSQISIGLRVADKSRSKWTVIILLCILFAGILGILAIISVVYFYKKRKSPEKYNVLMPKTLNDTDSQV